MSTQMQIDFEYLREYPKDFKGRKKYVSVRGFDHFIAAIYTYKGTDGRNYLLPQHGGDWSGYSGYSTSVKAPMLMKDIGEYTSPIDNTRITSRSEHREHMRRHGVIEVGNEFVQPVQRETPVDKNETARFIKNHLDKVREMDESAYQQRIADQEAQHAFDFGGE